jgi:hypothetical protein
MRTNLLVAGLALTTGTIAPSAHNDDLISSDQVGGLWYTTPDLCDGTSNLVPWYRRKLQRKELFEVPLNQLNVRAAHPTRLDFDKNFFGSDFGSFHFFKHKGLVIPMHSGCKHTVSPYRKSSSKPTFVNHSRINGEQFLSFDTAEGAHCETVRHMPVHQRHLAEIECYLSVFSHDQV